MESDVDGEPVASDVEDLVLLYVLTLLHPDLPDHIRQPYQQDRGSGFLKIPWINEHLLTLAKRF